MTTLAEYARDPRKHIELVAGEIVESPTARYPHFHIARHLASALEQHGLISGIMANLILDDSDPLRPLVRQPDVYVLREENQPDDDGLFQRAENTILVTEIITPGSGITDWIEKTSEYTDAGIAHYWIVAMSPDRSAHLYTFGLTDGGYEERKHWDEDVNIDIAGVRVQFDVRDLMPRKA